MKVNLIEFASALARDKEGRSMDASTAMIAITTNSSINVKAEFTDRLCL
jgi:hypothetical protein